MAPRRDSSSGRIFRLLLTLYPAAFRDEYGRELRLVFHDRYREAATWSHRAFVWCEAIVGLLAEAPKEHLRMVWNDLRYACRMLRHHALLTMTIVVTLALGIGANTAVFSVFNAVALRSPLQVPSPDELYTVNGGRYVASGQESARFSGPVFQLLRDVAPGDVAVAAMSRGIARVHTRVDGERETVPANLQLVSPEFFDVLRISPAVGRLPSEQTTATSDAVAVVSHGYWQRRLGGSPDVLGTTMTINGTLFTIIGVGPAEFVGVWLETPVDLWVPLTMQPAVQYSQSFSADGAALDEPWLAQERIWWLHVLARVPPGQVANAASVFEASISRHAGGEVNIVLEPFARGFSRFRQQFSTPLVALMIMATLVLLVACGNVANALLARAVARQREIAVRIAMGARRSRLVQQFLTESVLLVAMASVAAVLFARWAGDLLVRVATGTVDGVPPFAVSIDVRVLAFAAGVAFASVAVFGVWPAWRGARVDVLAALKSHTQSTHAGPARAARLLVIAQVALSLVLVSGTGLLARSFQRMLDVDLGFEPERLLTVDVDPRLSGTPKEHLAGMYSRVLEAVNGVPSVESSAWAMCGVQGSCARESGFVVEGYQPHDSEQVTFAVDAVTPGYFATMGMQLIAGRTLSESDREHRASVAVVNRSLALKYFSGPEEALGRRVGLGTFSIEIVGVTADARALGSLREPAIPSLFVPLAQRPVIPRVLEVRTSGDPAPVAATVRRAITDAAPELLIEGIDTVPARVRRAMSQERLVLMLTSAFSVLAISLAGFGLFGVLAYAVARRTPEIGLRMALGAQRSRVLWSVLRDAFRLVAAGVLLGLPLIVLGNRFASALVFGITPYDVVAVPVSLVVLLSVGAACAIVPALRAARIDPAMALRCE